MALLSGGMTARRFRVVGDLPANWRDVFRERLQKMAFREGGEKQGKEELEGWVEVQNLLDASFDDFNRWLFDTYVVFALRVDKKSLPAKLFKATVQKKCEAWCEERGVTRCPGAVKKEIKENLEKEWLARTLPRVATSEICWNVTEGWLVIDTLSESTGDRIRTRFHRTFGLELHPWSPLDYLTSSSSAQALLDSSAAAFGGDA